MWINDGDSRGSGNTPQVCEENPQTPAIPAESKPQAASNKQPHGPSNVTEVEAANPKALGKPAPCEPVLLDPKRCDGGGE